MPFDETLFIGVDPCGGRKPFTYAALDRNGKLVALQDGRVDDTLAFLGSQTKAYVAINAPTRSNKGLIPQNSMRLAEYQLRKCGIKIAMTPSSEDLCAKWIRSGFDFYRHIQTMGFLPYTSLNASRQWIETHPHAVFCVLLEQTPLAKSTLEGRLQRQLILYEKGLEIHDPMDFFEEITRHKLLKGNLPTQQVYTAKQLDAIAAAYMAYVAGRHPERVGGFGDQEEGRIFLPVTELKEKY